MEIEFLHLTLDNAQPEQWRRGKGCDRCMFTGYSGREALLELVEIDRHSREIIYNGTLTDLYRYFSARGYHSFRKAAIAKIISGTTTVGEVLRVLPHSMLVGEESDS